MRYLLVILFLGACSQVTEPELETEDFSNDLPTQWNTYSTTILDSVLGYVSMTHIDGMIWNRHGLDGTVKCTMWIRYNQYPDSGHIDIYQKDIVLNSNIEFQEFHISSNKYPPQFTMGHELYFTIMR